jgi:hypothetical protein
LFSAYHTALHNPSRPSSGCALGAALSSLKVHPLLRRLTADLTPSRPSVQPSPHPRTHTLRQITLRLRCVRRDVRGPRERQQRQRRAARADAVQRQRRRADVRPSSRHDAPCDGRAAIRQRALTAGAPRAAESEPPAATVFEYAPASGVAGAPPLRVCTHAARGIGFQLWPAAHAAVAYAEAREAAAPGAWRGVRVLELGAGCGLTGLAFAALGAEVVLTDLEDVAQASALVRTPCAACAAPCRLLTRAPLASGPAR